MNKEFEYRGHEFNIKVELNVQMERKPKCHIVTVNSTSGTDYHKEYQTQDNSLIGLEAYIDFAEAAIKKFIDCKSDGPADVTDSFEERLKRLGFK